VTLITLPASRKLALEVLGDPTGLPVVWIRSRGLDQILIRLIEAVAP